MKLIDNSYNLQRSDFEGQQQHSGHVFWFTGLSGSGKSTLCASLSQALFAAKIRFVVLDGDYLRRGLNKDCDFSEEGRTENLRRIAELSKFLLQQGHVVLCSFISPRESQRIRAQQIIGKSDFSLVYLEASLSLCETRDPKGLYASARKGDIENFTGIDSFYEVPSESDLTISTESVCIESCSHKLVQFCLNKIGHCVEFV